MLQYSEKLLMGFEKDFWWSQSGFPFFFETEYPIVERHITTFNRTKIFYEINFCA